MACHKPCCTSGVQCIPVHQWNGPGSGLSLLPALQFGCNGHLIILGQYQLLWSFKPNCLRQATAEALCDCLPTDVVSTIKLQKKSVEGSYLLIVDALFWWWPLLHVQQSRSYTCTHAIPYHMNCLVQTGTCVACYWICYITEPWTTYLDMFFVPPLVNPI